MAVVTAIADQFYFGPNNPATPAVDATYDVTGSRYSIYESLVGCE